MIFIWSQNQSDWSWSISQSESFLINMITSLSLSCWLLYLFLYLGIKWVVENCHGASLIFKTDDDMFINIYKLVSLVKYSNITKEQSMFGRCQIRSPVLRRKHKWALTKDTFPFNTYTPYCEGILLTAPTDINLYML